MQDKPVLRSGKSCRIGASENEEQDGFMPENMRAAALPVQPITLGGCPYPSGIKQIHAKEECEMRIYKGDIFYADLTPVVGCEQWTLGTFLFCQVL